MCTYTPKATRPVCRGGCSGPPSVRRGDRLWSLSVSETEVVEAIGGRVDTDAEDAGDGAQVVLADGEHPPVEVLALDLDHREVAVEHVGLGAAQVLEATQVDGEGALVDRERAGTGAVAEGGALVGGEQL